MPHRPGLVHRDIGSNTLHAPGLEPAVIDLSLTPRPVEWSVAILAVDAAAFEAAPHDVWTGLGEGPDVPQLLVRAALFRLATDAFLGLASKPQWTPVVREVLALARAH